MDHRSVLQEVGAVGVVAVAQEDVEAAQLHLSSHVLRSVGWRSSSRTTSTSLGGLETPQFVLEPLGLEHNDQDYDAWTSSGPAHPRDARVGGQHWPREMSPDENRADLQRHADDFRNRTGFTYTVLDPASRDVIGCVYIYPLPDSDYDARALSWVRASHAQLDTPLWRVVSDWLASDWPFGSVKYAPRA